ncbi:MAG TPA: hypothetical protein VJM31_09395 [Vicinamibacterales bacterium]|nr:hypothetical protein [Vicinamibacterales bacterium]
MKHVSDRCQKIASLLLMSALMVFEGTAAARQVPEERLDRQARDILDKLALGDFSGASARANGLRRPSDQAFATKLDQWTQEPNEQRLPRGTSASISLVEGTHLGACAHRIYKVRAAGGTERWRLSWRDSSDGWRLSDIALLK